VVCMVSWRKRRLVVASTLQRIGYDLLFRLLAYSLCSPAGGQYLRALLFTKAIFLSFYQIAPQIFFLILVAALLEFHYVFSFALTMQN